MSVFDSTAAIVVLHYSEFGIEEFAEAKAIHDSIPRVLENTPVGVLLEQDVQTER